MKLTKIRAGLYEYTDNKNRRWIIEHRLDDHGFWWCGTDDDPGADQYCSLWQAKAALTGFLKAGY